jgi:hypothetical protein
MKKSLAMLLVCLLTMSLLAGCAGTTVVVKDCGNCGGCCNGNANPSNPTDPTAPSVPVTPPAENAMMTGLSVSTSVSDSISATADKTGAAKFDVTVVAVLVDQKGVIVSCLIDSVPATVSFNNSGTITSDLSAAVPTKGELGLDYGMVPGVNATATWADQVAALCRYAEGKTVAELKNGAIDESGKAPAGSDLASSATIYLGGFVAGIEKAVANAQYLGAETGDTLKLSIQSKISDSVSAGEKAGTAQLDTDIAVLTARGDVISSCIIDSVQAKITFDASGKITTDLSKPLLTKNELGENYGMAARGSAIAEWNVQAAAFAQYVTGKTAAEVAGISVNEGTKPSEGTDLSASVTIAIGGFQALIAKAFA